MMEWEVLLADGTYRNSLEHEWGDGWPGVLVCWYWGTKLGDGVNWGDGLYGRPDTLAAAGFVADDEWARIERDVIAVRRVRPSER